MINLPGTSELPLAAHGEEEQKVVYPRFSDWTTVESREEYMRLYPHMPARIVDNLMKNEAIISVAPWNTIAQNAAKLEWLIESTFQDRAKCIYDLRRPMRRRNS